MQVQDSIHIEASPQAVFDVLADVNHWPDWDSAIHSTGMEGSVEVEKVFWANPHRGPRAVMYFREIESPTKLVFDHRLPHHNFSLFTLRFEYEVQPEAEGSRYTRRVVLSGPLLVIAGPIVASLLKKELPGSLAGLKRAAESLSPN